MAAGSRLDTWSSTHREGVRISMRSAIIALAGSLAVAVVSLGATAPPETTGPPDRSKADGPPGIRTVEASPSGGLAYRLFMSATATPETPNRLIVWLHPSGGLMLDTIEEMAPLFTRCGFAVVAATDKAVDGWSDRDIGKLMNVTLRNVGKIPGVDARYPILMGFSGGGQAALALWLARPSRFGGVIVDAAYPVQFIDGKGVPADLPADDAVKRVPFFVVVGELDHVVSIWQQVEKPWRDAGVPLTVHYIPGKGHEWMFDEQVTARLEEWLKGIPARAAAPP